MSRRKIAAVPTQSAEPAESVYELSEAFAYEQGGSYPLNFEKALRAMAFLMEHASEQMMDINLEATFGQYLSECADKYHRMILPFAEKAIAERDAPIEKWRRANKLA